MKGREAILSARIFTVGMNQYKCMSDGTWFALMIGSFPNRPYPSSRWVAIPESKVPATVRDLIKEAKG